MSNGNEHQPNGLRIIDGGLRPGAAANVQLQLPTAPRMGPAELAAELAELYAMALVRDLPFALMQDPHCEIWIDASTRFTLHELLCELRSLSWFNDQALPVPGPVETVLCSRAVCGDADHRRTLRLNGDGQLTLRSLFRGVVAHRGPTIRLSTLHATDHRSPSETEPCSAPEADAPMSRWLDYIERCSGASLAAPAPGDPQPEALITPRALAERLHGSHPCRIYFNAALRLLARQAPLDPGLEGIAPSARVSAQTLLSMMADCAERAFTAAMRMQGRADRLSRPGVTAARITALLASEDQPCGSDGDIAACAEELAGKTPQLLHWVDRMNRAQGRTARGRSDLHLPSLRADLPPHRADHVAKVVVAGALSTLLKAVFDSRRHARLRMVGSSGSGIDIGAEADRLAGDVALARSVTGSAYQAENFNDLRLGEAIACQVLRSRFEAQGQGLSMGFTNFDGRLVDLAVHAHGGSGHATFRLDGRLAPWPMEASRNASHLAVV
ncbi:bromoperoxidase [Salipiger bermudensis]|uniref:bromoperoxidase n=1 Tax=Salipiger bermudensis TaxID=344736 RepID=UPI001C9A02B7|nr:bromoperoxidase [Salipiger bermudensis]MBY6004845.1 bromoperoxidase [Salipiger bermudensis]